MDDNFEYIEEINFYKECEKIFNKLKQVNNDEEDLKRKTTQALYNENSKIVKQVPDLIKKELTYKQNIKLELLHKELNKVADQVVNLLLLDCPRDSREVKEVLIQMRQNRNELLGIVNE